MCKRSRVANAFARLWEQESYRSRIWLFVTTGNSRHIDTVHHNVHCRTDVKYDTGNAGERRSEGRIPGQSIVRHGRVGVHYVVYAGIPVTVQRVTEQMEIFQRWPKRDRLASHTAVLRVANTGRGDGQDGHASVRRRAPCDTDIPNHAYTAYIETGPTFHWAAEPRIHTAQLIQGARPAHAVPGNGRVDILQSGVFRGERGTRHQVPVYTGNVLVGRHYYDHRRLRRHLPDNGLGQSHRRRLLYLWRIGYCSAHSHYRQQFCRVL